MRTSFFRSTAAAAAVGIGAVTFVSGPAAAQTCYPPSPACTIPTSPPSVAPTSIVATTVTTSGQVGGVNVGTGTGTGGTGNLAKTGVYLIPALLIGLGLVTGGVVLKRSGKQSRAKSAV